MSPFEERLSEATAKRPRVQLGRRRHAWMLTAGFALAVTSAPSAQTDSASASAAKFPQRPWVIVTLNASDPMLPATAALDSAMRKALTEPGRHPVDLFSES